MKCAPKKFENPAKLFDPSVMPSVMVQMGHVSDMRGPSVMLSVCDVGNCADGHVSDMRADNSVGDAVGIGVGNAVGECGKIP